MENKYEGLKLRNQLCFPLYSVSNLIIRRYKPLLDKLNLTYTQYITMMVLWERESISEKELSSALFLKSNTLTPLLRKLVNKGYIHIDKNIYDERSIVISLTERGRQLKDEAVCVPASMASAINLSAEEAVYLYNILYKILEVES
ncbi:MAG: MarR family transcriptional regulator [Erysipelotrichaceae bacterium]|nr:MarR family transcriptional regulator [Erysipelotrichaceae bacterium]